MIDWQLQSKLALRRLRLLSPARTLRQGIAAAVSPSVRRHARWVKSEARDFEREHGAALRQPLADPGRPKKRALITDVGSMTGVAVELLLAKALESANVETTVLTNPDSWAGQYTRLANSVKLRYWDEFICPGDPREAEAQMASVETVDQLLALRYSGARIGRFAASSALRRLRVGTLDLQRPEVRQALLKDLNRGIAYTQAARLMLREINPDIAIFVDRGYSPAGELFDVCLNEGVDTLTWNTAHKSNALMLKRYTLDNRDEHPASLSEETWRNLSTGQWTDAHRQRLHDEIHNSYASGDWYSDVGTQFGKTMFNGQEISERLGLDANRKTAVIFPHILWDGTFFWGNDLFANYEEWLVETVRAACANDRVNWVIKVHPANVVKDARDGYLGEPSEVIAINRHVGALPSHVSVIPADSDINTYSLFSLMDYCITVRGTIGMEVAAFGIPVVTAGTGRYDRRGFTIDSETPAQYLERISNIEEIPPLSLQELELAQRFAYGVFVMRPLPLSTVSIDYQQDQQVTSKIRVNARTKEDWLSSPDLTSFARWVKDRSQEDFLWSDPVSEIASLKA